MKKFVLAPALAALAMFFWGFLYWGAPHHLPYKALGTVADDAATAEAVGKLFPASGAYLLPSPLLSPEKLGELSARGPLLEVHVRKEGTSVMDPSSLVAGYFHMFMIAVILAAILNGLHRSFETWTCRVKFSAIIGLLVAVGDLGNVIWWHHAWGWTLAQCLYDFVAYLLAGLVLAKFLTPKSLPPPLAA
jgi:hypothetical protein